MMHHGGGSLNRLSFSATVHCLTGCAIGEVLGMVLSTWWGWGGAAPLIRSGMSLRQVAPLASASGTASISTMEIGLIARGRGHAVMHAHH